MLCSFSCSVLLFISTAIMFWTDNYLKKVIKADDDSIFAGFIITAVTAPASGIIIGGIIVEKLGGYESRRAIVACLFFGIGAAISAIPIVIFNNVGGFASFLWLFLFFGGSVIPNLMGILISSLPKDLRSSGSSLANLINNTFGFIPSPFLYGLIYKRTEETSPKTAYGFIVFYSYVSIILLIAAYIIKEKEDKITDKENSKAQTQAESKKEEEIIVINERNSDTPMFKSKKSDEEAKLEMIKLEDVIIILNFLARKNLRCKS